MESSRSFPSTESRRNVAVLIDPGDSWGRRVILAVSAAVRHLLPWDLLIAPQDDQWRHRIPQNWHGDGIITEVRDEKTAQHVRSLDLPTIHTSYCDNTRDSRYRVITDDRKRAEMAFHHFLERGFQNYAYYGPCNQRYPESRGEIFRDVVVAAGYECDVFQHSGTQRNPDAVRIRATHWLKQLARPVAIFAGDPHPALQLTQICQAAGIHIPEDVAVLAGDSDDVLCDIADPPLSSILLACEQIGAQSVNMLQSIFQGKSPEHPHLLVPPMRVLVRQSTDILAVKDEFFSQALRFIRENAHHGIQVTDILRHVPISRRGLEQRFLRYLNRSPADEIRKVRLERVKYLLVATDQSNEQIAIASGFSSSSQMGVVFRKMLGMTPMDFRKANRRRDQ
ncbi:MAG: AraC family transcriptional regulator [Schlesneria sp.]|nr:AraC family transcriptional regulator [Schlesneria sp.]